MICNRLIDDCNTIDTIHGEMLTKTVEILRQRLERHHLAVSAYDYRRYQRVKSNVCANIEHNVSNSNVLFENKHCSYS